MTNRVWCFGDSWGAGAELAAHEKPFVHWVSKKLNLAPANRSRSGNSLGIILHNLVSDIQNITKDDVVLIIVPPDIRWYSENEDIGFYSVSKHNREEYLKIIENKTLEWFRYHHAIFIYAIQKILDDIGCQYLMAHNYGDLEFEKYHLKIDHTKFLHQKDLTTLLSGQKGDWKNYNDTDAEHRFDHDGPPQNLFFGIYFEGCRYHPNELGHRRIAELMLEKLTAGANQPA